MLDDYTEALDANRHGLPAFCCLLPPERLRFEKPSPVRALEEAVGQYEVYRIILGLTQPGLPLYMAVPRGFHDSGLPDAFGQAIVAGANLRLLVFDERQKRIVRWIE